MKKTFKLEGLECANCAAKMERGIKALDGVTECTINFMTSKMTLEAADDRMDEVVTAARRVVKKFEPNVELK